MLGEANIQTVFTSNIRRTHQTASPLAKARHLTIQTIPKDNPDELVQKAKAAAQNGDVLIVAIRRPLPISCSGWAEEPYRG